MKFTALTPLRCSFYWTAGLWSCGSPKGTTLEEFPKDRRVPSEQIQDVVYNIPYLLKYFYFEATGADTIKVLLTANKRLINMVQ